MFASSRTNRPVLLIVDDEPDNATSLHQFLQHALPHVDVVSTTSTDEAGRFVADNRVDAILVDYRMPGEDGVSFVERLHESRPDLPAVLMTAYPHPDVMAAAVNRGHVAGLFVKPFDEGRLVLTLERLLLKRQGSVGRIPWRPTFGGPPVNDRR